MTCCSFSVEMGSEVDRLSLGEVGVGWGIFLTRAESISSRFLFIGKAKRGGTLGLETKNE